MKFDPSYAIIAFIFLSAMGIGSYWYVSLFDIIPQELLDQYYLYASITSIPFLIWMCFTKTDKEWNDIIEKEKKERIENEAIKRKYELLPDLVKK